MASSQAQYIKKRDHALRISFTIFMAVAIAALGWVMMTISSYLLPKVSFLWLPLLYNCGGRLAH